MQNKTILLLCLSCLLWMSCTKEEFSADEIPVVTITLDSATSIVDYYLYDDARLLLDASIPGALSYQWQPTGETSAVVEFIPNKFESQEYSSLYGYWSGVYEVAVQMPDTVFIYTFAVRIDESVVFCPNSFTPNGDGKNDRWCVFFSHFAVQCEDLNIYDMENKRIFHAGPNDDLSWDGTYKGNACGAGTYYFTFKYSSAQNKKKFRSGIISLLR